MPNWCYNKLVVSATRKSDLYDFVEKMGCEDEEGNQCEFTFNALVKRPKSEEGNWYDWNVNNWGTKWDASEPSVYVNDVDYKVDVTFDTAWSPPIEWLEKVAPQFPQLQFSLLYHEGGMGFAGELICEDGKEFSHAQYGSGEEGYWMIATEGLDDDEIEDRAKENITYNALDYWEYSLDRLVEILGEEKRLELENLLIVKKLSGDLGNSTPKQYSGGDIEDIVDKLMGKDKFFEHLFNEKKEKGELRRYAV